MDLSNIDYSIFIPPLAGSMVTIIFIVLNGIYESKKKREKAILNSFKRELNDNKRIMAYNVAILKNE